MGYKITDFPPNVQEQIKNELRKSSGANRGTPTPSHMESHTCDEPVGAKAGAGHDSPCSCLIHSFRHRLADPDGVSIHVTPTAKPRMTRSDKWKKRKCVVQYRAYCDAVRQHTSSVDLSGVVGVSWLAYLPMPKSWSPAKKAKMSGRLHLQKPDRDNIDKGLLDAIFKEDSHISFGFTCKLWDDGKGERVEIFFHKGIDEHGFLV